jgi:hypothetical protein
LKQTNKEVKEKGKEKRVKEKEKGKEKRVKREKLRED